MSLKAQFKTSESLEKKGIIIEFGPDTGDTRVTIARAGGANQKYNAAVEKASRSFRRDLSGQMDPSMTKAANKVFKKIFAELVVLNWEVNMGTDEKPDWKVGILPEDAGVRNCKKCELLEVNVDNVLKVFNYLPSVYNALVSDASSDRLFKENVKQAEAGN